MDFEKIFHGSGNGRDSGRAFRKEREDRTDPDLRLGVTFQIVSDRTVVQDQAAGRHLLMEDAGEPLYKEYGM